MSQECFCLNSAIIQQLQCHGANIKCLGARTMLFIKDDELQVFLSDHLMIMNTSNPDAFLIPVAMQPSIIYECKVSSPFALLVVKCFAAMGV